MAPRFAKQLGQQNEEDELLVCFKADWQEEAGNNELPTGNKIPHNQARGMTALVLMMVSMSDYSGQVS